MLAAVRGKVSPRTAGVMQVATPAIRQVTPR